MSEPMETVVTADSEPATVKSTIKDSLFFYFYTLGVVAIVLGALLAVVFLIINHETGHKNNSKHSTVPHSTAHQFTELKNAPHYIRTQDEETFFYNVKTGNLRDVSFAFDDNMVSPDLIDPVTGRTVLHAAVLSHDLTMVDIILERISRFDPDIVDKRDNAGVTPLTLAKSQSCYSLVDNFDSDCYRIIGLLQLHGAHE